MQQIALVDTETGECGERRLWHRAEAEEFYRELKGKQVRVAIEATGHSRWLAELNVELWTATEPFLHKRTEPKVTAKNANL